MDRKTVRDVIGEPESWPNYLNGHSKEPTDMRGAVITVAFVSGDQIALQTKGAACGETFATFVVKDKELRDRLTQVLRPELSVHEAAAVAI
jgi:hypothetical protein